MTEEVTFDTIGILNIYLRQPMLVNLLRRIGTKVFLPYKVNNLIKVPIVEKQYD